MILVDQFLLHREKFICVGLDMDLYDPFLTRPVQKTQHLDAGNIELFGDGLLGKTFHIIVPGSFIK